MTYRAQDGYMQKPHGDPVHGGEWVRSRAAETPIAAVLQSSEDLSGTDYIRKETSTWHRRL